MAGQAGEHQPKTIQQLRPRSEGGANTGNGRALVQGKGGGNIQYLVHIGTRRLCHAPPCVCGQGFQIPPRPFGVQYAKRKRAFPGAGHARNADDPI